MTVAVASTAIPGATATKKKVNFANLGVGAAMNMFEVTTLGQPFEVIKTHLAANRQDNMATAFKKIYQRGGIAGFYQGYVSLLFSSRLFSSFSIFLFFILFYFSDLVQLGVMQRVINEGKMSLKENERMERWTTSSECGLLCWLSGRSLLGCGLHLTKCSRETLLLVKINPDGVWMGQTGWCHHLPGTPYLSSRSLSLYLYAFSFCLCDWGWNLEGSNTSFD